jgi:uncharacterized protein (DUF924 family)
MQGAYRAVGIFPNLIEVVLLDVISSAARNFAGTAYSKANTCQLKTADEHSRKQGHESHLPRVYRQARYLPFSASD